MRRDPEHHVEIVASERDARRDFATFCRHRRHRLLHSRLEPGRGIAFFIRK